ncbi:hypothetical protein HDU84_006079, partial [Entophlyctis sp. JEL0112]
MRRSGEKLIQLSYTVRDGDPQEATVPADETEADTESLLRRVRNAVSGRVVVVLRETKVRSWRSAVTALEGILLVLIVLMVATFNSTLIAGVVYKIMFDIVEASVADIRVALDCGAVSSVQLVEAYLERIKKLEHLHAVIETNPDALALALAADAERLGTTAVPPMHGIPVLIKDNIATRDRMNTTAGCWILVDSVVPRDAFVVSKLRAAGAIILGKTNLSEWSNWRIGEESVNGWSGRGGQTVNPYGGEVGGSSSGSAVAATASLAAACIGSETDGSIIYPALLNGVVGMKPTVGFVSRAGVIPISHTLDSVGPLTRSVADAAALLDVIVGSDPNDLATADAEAKRPTQSFVRSVQQFTVNGLRVGVDSRIASMYSRGAVKFFENMGASVVRVEFPDVEDFRGDEMTVFMHEFKHGINSYLSELKNTNLKNLQDVIDAVKADARENMYSTSLLEDSQRTRGLEDAKYLAALETITGDVRKRLHTVFAACKVDIIVGDPLEMFSTAAMAGFPIITVPAGIKDGMPQGVGFVGRPFDDAVILGAAYVFEQTAAAAR